MQARSVAARRHNKTIREAMMEALQEEGGGGYTKLEILVRRAMENHNRGKLTFMDIRCLASIMGEDKLSIETNGPAMVIVPESAIAAIDKWKKK